MSALRSARRHPRTLAAALVLSSFTLVGGLADTARAQAPDHLLISEVCSAGSDGEFIELYNPTNTTIDLSNYYLADVIFYARTPNPFGTPASNDFVARFPSGASIAAGARKVVAFNAAGYFTTYGVHADYKMPPDDFTTPPQVMLPAWGGSVGFGRGLTDAGEGLYLYHWDQASDLVDDVDILRFGQPDANNNLATKNGISIDGPDPDSRPTPYINETITMGTMIHNAGAGLSYKRLFIEGVQEISCGGNGITGNQEYTENIAITWDGSGANTPTAPTPGSGPTLVAPPGPCFADINNDSSVNVADLLTVIGAWGPCANCPAQPCAADISPPTCTDCTVNVSDLLAVIANWGPCP